MGNSLKISIFIDYSVIIEPLLVGMETEQVFISIFPVPAKDQLNVMYRGNPETIRVTDLLGKETGISVSPVPGSNSVMVDISALSSGVYLIYLEGKSKTTAARFSVIR